MFFHSRASSSNTPSLLKRKPIAFAVNQALLILSCLAVPAYHAQAAEPAAATAQAKPYDIAPGPLAEALSRFASEAKVTLSFVPTLVKDKRSNGLNGTHTPASGLNQLLVGTGLTAVLQGKNSYVLQAQAQAQMQSSPTSTSSGAALPEVTVRSTPENAPVQGYIARRSTSATKTNTALIETPQSISVITRDNMNDRSAQSVSDALLYSANVNGQRYGADTRSDYFTIRGFPADLYLDGLRIAQIANQTGGYAGFLVEPYSLDRVEVLRGPSSALFGQSNVGGIVNMVSKEPQLVAAGETYVRLGSYNRKELGFDLTGPVGDDDRLSYRINGMWREGDAIQNFGRNNRVAFNPSIAWRPDANTSLIVSAGYLKDDLGQVGAIIPAKGSVLPNALGLTIPVDFTDGDPRFATYKKETAYVGYRLEHHFNDTFTLRHNLRYSHLKADYRNLFTSGLLADERTITRTTYNAQPELDALAIDTQLEAKFNTGPIGHTLLTGMDNQWQKLVNNTGSLVGPRQDLYDPTYSQALVAAPVTTRLSQVQRQTGFYMQDQMAIGKARLLAAIRKDFVRVDSDSTTLATAVTTRYQQNPSKTTGKIGASYLFDSGFAPYAMYSTSFLPTLTLTATPLKPTTGTVKELGVKYAPTNSDYSVTLSAFEAVQQNVVNRVATVYYQTDEVRIRGVELEGVAAITKRLNLTAAYSVQDPKVTQSQTASQVGKLPYTVPKTQQSLFVSYDVPLAENNPGHVTIGGGARRIGKTAGDTENTFFVPSYTLVDAFLRYDFDRYSVQLNAYNLGNKTYVAGCNTTTQCYYGPERTMVATLKYHW